MGALSALAFLNPWVLAGLAALPVLWWLLRATPPTPKRQFFAPIRLLLGLEDEKREADRTPWWLLLLRMLAIAAALIGFAQPVLNPTERLSEGADGPLLLVMDQGWASAPDWQARQRAAASALDEAAEAGRQVLFWPLGDGEAPPLASAEAVRPGLEGAVARPWPPNRAGLLEALQAGDLPTPAETIWLHDGLAHGPETEALLDRLAAHGPLRLIGPERLPPALTPPYLDEGRMAVDVLRVGGGAESIPVAAIAATETGAERRIAVARAEFGAGETQAMAVFDLPPELIGEVTRLILPEQPSAGGAALAGGAVQRVAAAIVDSEIDQAIASLTSPSHYLRKAMVPWADLREGSLDKVLDAEPAVILLADFGELAPATRDRLVEWVEAGGLLIRFAGPRLAAALGERMASAGAPDPLLPVRLRRGGRVLGGALAWSRPKGLGPFGAESPFRGLDTSEEVEIRTQVLAEPGPDLAEKVWAVLDDGTPLVTGAPFGGGTVVLFHITADAEWSSLPLSGLFVEILGRLMALAPGQIPAAPDAEALAGSLWRADRVIGTDGTPQAASANLDTVSGERLAAPEFGPGLPSGLYARSDAGRLAPGAARELVLSLYRRGDALAPFPEAPAGTVVETLGGAEAERLAQWFLLAALALALADILATLAVSGRLPHRHRARAGAAGLLLGIAAAGLSPAQGEAQELPFASIEITAETTLAYVATGDARVDRVSARALVGLGNALAQRTAVEPGPPVRVDPETDELAFFPVLYWPLIGGSLPSDAALARLADYIAAGGLILIDTQNGSSGFKSASAVDMRRIARALNLPPLKPVDRDHVLTRTFYLLDRFPGRWRGGAVWAEAPPPGQGAAERVPGLAQFDRVDDNVSPVIVGSADWAAAWAVDDRGQPLYPVGRPGDRQREMALRFGINLVMYSLTGNYKSDQVHAPEVLRRLGQ